jgi:hypothetical protein
MRKLKYVAAVCAALVAMPTLASAHIWYPPIPPKPVIVPPHLGTSSAFGAGAAATTGFLGFVAVLAGYDLLRRTTCSGDFLGLGGPGFGEPMPNGNVMIPQCKIVKAKHVVRARG